MKCKRMLATRTAATGTIRNRCCFCDSGAMKLVSITARSFLQKSFSTRFNAIGLTFHVSPEI